MKPIQAQHLCTSVRQAWQPCHRSTAVTAGSLPLSMNSPQMPTDEVLCFSPNPPTGIGSPETSSARTCWQDPASSLEKASWFSEISQVRRNRACNPNSYLVLEALRSSLKQTNKKSPTPTEQPRNNQDQDTVLGDMAQWIKSPLITPAFHIKWQVGNINGFHPQHGEEEIKAQDKAHYPPHKKKAQKTR